MEFGLNVAYCVKWEIPVELSIPVVYLKATVFRFVQLKVKQCAGVIPSTGVRLINLDL